MRARYCPQCGARLRRSTAAGGAPCSRCGRTFWNNPAPAASVLILCGHTVLLARRAFAPLRGYWDAIGGFVQPGETAEQGARREIREELGVDVVLDRFVGALPDVYGTRDQPTLNLYYAGHLAHRDAVLHPTDDITEVRWFPLDALPRRIAFPSSRRALRLLRPRRRGQRQRRAASPPHPRRRGGR